MDNIWVKLKKKNILSKLFRNKSKFYLDFTLIQGKIWIILGSNLDKRTWTALIENSGRRRTDWSFLPRPKTPGSTTSSSESYVSSYKLLFLKYDPSKPKHLKTMSSFLHIGNLKIHELAQDLWFQNFFSFDIKVQQISKAIFLETPLSKKRTKY